MTLIVGVLCEGGVVVGADGAATLGSMGQQTARQPVKKLTKVGTRIIVGVSGPVGLGQQLIDRVHGLAAKSAFKPGKCPTTAQAIRIVSEEFRKDIGPAIEAAKVAVDLVGNQNASQSALTHSLVALPVKGKPSLLQFDFVGAGEAATPDLPYVAIGSGQGTADQFLAFIRRVLWKDRLPNVADGRLAATWTLTHAIKTSPGGVADPIQLMVLEGEEVTEVSGPDLDTHKQFVQEIEDHLAEIPEKLQGSDDDVAPLPPPAEPA